MRKIIKILLIIFLFITPFVFSNNIKYLTISANSDLEKELEEVQRKLGELRKQKQGIDETIEQEKAKQGDINSQIKLISSERQALENEVQEKELVIEELNLQVEILNETIEETEKAIKKTKGEIEDLEVEADQQLSDMYVDLKTNNAGLNMIFQETPKSLVKNGLYQKTIQEETNSSLRSLKEKNEQLKKDKVQVEEDKKKVEEDKKQLDEEKKKLDEKQAQLQGKINSLIALYNQAQKSINATKELDASLSDEEAKLLAEEEKLKQQIFNRVGKIDNGMFVKKGTIIGYQGLTGLTTGYHLHFGVKLNGGYRNPCEFLPPGKFGSCAGNSSLDWPMKGSFYYTSPYGPRKLGDYTSYHYAIDIAHPTNHTPIYAAHDGWYTRGFEPCDSSYWLCKNGGANYVVLCENKDNCNAGFKTLYYHLK
jgi:peptidoglycan hydrolase CwlO-like protein